MGLACGTGAAANLGTEAAPLRFVRADYPELSEEIPRSIQLAFTVADQALGPEIQTGDCGVALTISKGLIEELESAAGTAWAPEPIWRYDAAAAARAVAARFKLSGPVGAAVAACASGLASMKLAQEWLRDGRCSQVLAGASESTRSPMVLRSFARLGVLSPEGITRPFDSARAGFVVGEGAGVVLLESAERIRSEGRNILGIIRSLVLGADGFHLTSPDPSGTALANTIRVALERAQIETSQIGWVHAHGTGTEYNDAVEIRALRSVFGERVPPVTATKGITGHLLGASGAVALVLTVRALNEGVIPGIVGLRIPDIEFSKIDFVLQTRACDAGCALVLNHGFGGHIAVAVVQRRGL